MKLAVSGGGTGGHVYPGLTVIKLLLDPKPAGSMLPTLQLGDLLWIGGRGEIESDLVGRADIDFVGLASGGLRGMGPLVVVRNALSATGGRCPRCGTRAAGVWE